MAKRSARYKSRDSNFEDDDKVHRLYPSRGGWNPRDSEEGRDRKYVPRHDAVIQYWTEDQVLLADGITMIRCGGHFPGSAVLHWAAGAGGAGVLLTGDTLQVRPDKKLTFMHSYPNLIPLDGGAVQRIADRLEPWPFETIYGGWWERVIPAHAKTVMAESVAQYLNAIGGMLTED